MTSTTQRSPKEFLPDREARNPYFRFLVHLGVPMSVSLLLHAIIAGVLAWTTWTIVAPPSPQEYEAGIVQSPSADAGLKWPGEAEIEVEAPQELPPVEAMRFSDPSDLRELSDARAPTGDDSGGFGIGESGRAGVIGTGSGAGESGAGGLGSGLGASSGIGRAGVWNLSASGNKFVYVIDYSGSIVVAVEDLKRELKRSIGMLRGTQHFNVILFYGKVSQGQDEFVTEGFAADLVAASADEKRKFFGWIDRKEPQGSTEPLVALKRALAMKPDAVFLFSDGYFDDKVVESVAKANPGKRTQIHCLVFDELLLQDSSGMDKLTDGAKRLQKIADQNGGRTKIVTSRDINRK